MSHQTSEETQRKAIIRAWNALEASADDLVKKNGGKYIIIYQGSPKDEFEILSNSGNFRNAFNSGAVQTAFTKAQMTTTLDTMKANEQKEAATWVMARARGPVCVCACVCASSTIHKPQTHTAGGWYQSSARMKRHPC